MINPNCYYVRLAVLVVPTAWPVRRLRPEAAAPRQARARPGTRLPARRSPGV